MTRVPPHNLEAEESLLGAMLLSRDAISAALDRKVESGDFYKPAHGHIYEAIALLYQQNDPADPVTVGEFLDRAGLLARLGGSQVLLQLQANTPASANAAHYARIVKELSVCRQVIGYAEELADVGYDSDVDELAVKLAEANELSSGGVIPVEPPPRASELAEEEIEVEFVIPRLLARQEIALLVATGGVGKTTLMRQFAACGASGLHPFTRVPMPRITTLTFDFQDPPGPAISETRKMIQCAGESFGDSWFVELKRDGVDLTSPRGQAWFEAKIAAVMPDLVLAGPVYNMVRGAPHRPAESFESVLIATQFVVDLMVRYNVAMILEAHAPRDQSQGIRMRGSKLWEDWAAFAFGLDDVGEDGVRRVKLTRSRYDRATGREWPRELVEGVGRWPWDAVGIPERPPEDPWEQGEVEF